MTGPKIIRREAPEAKSRQRHRGETGIRATNDGGWAAVKDGKLVDVYTGAGARRMAIRTAGTNLVLA